MPVAPADHPAGGLVLELELGGERRRGGDFGGRGPGPIKPCADAVVGQLRLIPHQGAMDLSVGDGSLWIDCELGDHRGAVLALVQGSQSLGELRREHGEDLDSGVDRGGFGARVLVERGIFVYGSVDIGDADEDADAAVGEGFGPLDLVEVAGGVVVDGGPEEAAHVFDRRRVVRCGQGRRSGGDGGQLAGGFGGEVRGESVLEHGGVGGRGEIELG